jgi:hypothetical protein
MKNCKRVSGGASAAADINAKARGCLAAVGVGTGIRHRQEAGNVVLVLEVLVGELCAVDALATGSVVVGEVASLQHEAWDHAVEAGALVTAEVIMRSARK